MNVVFVSQCTKRALTETRRILDQFAERRGDRTWQTPITQAGLLTVRKLLRQKARKNTAVACHWIRGRDHSELLWVVGDSSQFNNEGAVPTNTTASNVLQATDENNWHSLKLISAMTALAALLHDLGKATQAFQQKLADPGLRERNLYRHEWVSVRLFQAFVGHEDDEGWLKRLEQCADLQTDVKSFEQLWLDFAGGRLLRDGLGDAGSKDAFPLPFSGLVKAPLAQAVAWLVFTHHRLPCKPVELSSDGHAFQDDSEVGKFRKFGSRVNFLNHKELNGLLAGISADWNEPRSPSEKAKILSHWSFPHGLPVTALAWRKQAARCASRLRSLLPPTQGHALHNPFVMHVSRLCLMLADHHYSSIQDEERRSPYLNKACKLYANTVRNFGQDNNASGRKVVFNQTLDEHLLGVQAHSALIAHSLPRLTNSLPALKNHKLLTKRSADPRFAWQNKASDLALSIRDRAVQQGAFIVNMASTGCGKTLGNARVMNALANPATGMRCAFAIGLRTLTLQTGRSFQNDLALDEEQLAIQVGGAASRELFEYWEQQAEATGSASCQSLLDEAVSVNYDGKEDHPLLQRLSDDSKVRRLLAAPVLVCTIDHLTPATESLRGGRQIGPMLRLMTGDLVLDEPDDFDTEDLPALTRLVHWAGLLGSKVLLSSATLPPALVEGLFLAYRAGRASYQLNRGERPSEAVNVCCVWIDEFHQTTHDCPDAISYRQRHESYLEKRIAKLKQSDARRYAQIAPLPTQWSGVSKSERLKDFARLVLEQAWQLHQNPCNHTIDPKSGKRISIGLIRMANIAPLYQVALAMYSREAIPSCWLGKVRIHLCVYHSQFPMILRSAIEQQLDGLLDRRGATAEHDPAIHRPALRSLIDEFPEPDHLFVVLGSPVTEVGRDHDYDWAVVEPSSMRSIIQLAGRVRRHRPWAVNEVNMTLLDGNLKRFQSQNKAAYCMPGFEQDPPSRFTFKTRSLSDLLARHLNSGGNFRVDARPRIQVPDGQLIPGSHLEDMEHARMHAALLPKGGDAPVMRDSAYLYWYESEQSSPRALWLTGLLPQFQRFRDDTQRRGEVVFLPDEDEDSLLLYGVQKEEKKRTEALYAPVDEYRCHQVPAQKLRSPVVSPWLRLDLLEELVKLSESKGWSLKKTAERFAMASLPENQEGWWWDERLGFCKKT